MSIITDILSAPAKGLLDGVGDIIGKFVKDPTEALKAQEQAMALQNSFQIAIIQADKEFAQAQAGVIEADDKAGWLAANWRPITMLAFVGCICYNFIVVPIFGLKGVEIPVDMWTVIKIGLAGYLTGHTVEQVAPTVADAWSSRGINLNDIANASKVGVKVP